MIDCDNELDYCHICGVDCTYYDTLIWYHVTKTIILSFCGNECYKEYKKEREP